MITNRAVKTTRERSAQEVELIDEVPNKKIDGMRRICLS